MQTSALSFSVCFNVFDERFKQLLADLQKDFKVKYNTGLTLMTMRHYRYIVLKELTRDKTVLLEQVSRSTAQVVLK
jgi:aspartate kinase